MGTGGRGLANWGGPWAQQSGASIEKLIGTSVIGYCEGHKFLLPNIRRMTLFVTGSNFL